MIGGRDSIKAVARAAATVAASPFLLSFWLRAALLGRDRALEGSSQMLALVPGLLGRYLRQAFLSHTIAACHHTVVVEFGTLFSQTGARLDERVYVGPRCHLGLVHLEPFVMLAAGVHVTSGAHVHQHSRPDQPIQLQPTARQLVRVGEGSWIGSGAVVMADIGRNTIVGAGAVVTHPIPDGVVAAGVPARVLRQRA